MAGKGGKRNDGPKDNSALDTDGIFVYYDRDGDGRLTKDEFLRALRGSGACPSPAAFEEVCKSFGTTPDATAFKAALEEMFSMRPTQDHFVETCRALSQGGNVDAEVLKYVVTHYGEVLNETEVDELLLALGPRREALPEAASAAPEWAPGGGKASGRGGGSQASSSKSREGGSLV